MTGAWALPSLLLPTCRHDRPLAAGTFTRPSKPPLHCAVISCGISSCSRIRARLCPTACLVTNSVFTRHVSPCGWTRRVLSGTSRATSGCRLLPVFTFAFGSLNWMTRAFDTQSYIFRIGNILFSVETQTTEERTQLYHAEMDALYKDLTAKGKVLVLSSELGVGLAARLSRFLWVSCKLFKASALSLGLYLCLGAALVDL